MEIDADRRKTKTSAAEEDILQNFVLKAKCRSRAPKKRTNLRTKHFPRACENMRDHARTMRAQNIICECHCIFLFFCLIEFSQINISF